MSPCAFISTVTIDFLVPPGVNGGKRGGNGGGEGGGGEGGHHPGTDAVLLLICVRSFHS